MLFADQLEQRPLWHRHEAAVLYAPASARHFPSLRGAGLPIAKPSIAGNGVKPARLLSAWQAFRFKLGGPEPEVSDSAIAVMSSGRLLTVRRRGNNSDFILRYRSMQQLPARSNGSKIMAW